MNIVKMRYIDLPIFLDVGSVVSGYQWETAGSIGGTVSSKGAIQGNYMNLGVQGRFTDRPTITYIPKTGDKFLEGMIKPISPASVFYLVQVGYAADFVLEMSLDSLCGLNNRSTAFGSEHKADPAFFEALRLLREIQDANGLGMQVEAATKDRSQSTVMFFRQEDVDPDTLAKSARVRELLRLPRDVQKYRLVDSPMRGQGDELTVSTRSMLQIMVGLSRGVEVPAAHQERKLTPPLLADREGAGSLLQVRSGLEKPADAFAAVPYDGAWFWISNDDWRSKRSFVAIMFLFTMVSTPDQERGPVLTIPTQ